MRPRWRSRLGALLSACAVLEGCAHVDLNLRQFMTADEGLRTARLAGGYAVESRILVHSGQSIGITYAHRAGTDAVILYCGGSGFRRLTEGGIPLQALALNADVALFDYPGLGDSSGAPSTVAILDTAAAVYDEIFSLASTRGKKRVLYGFSLGGMVAAHLAQDRSADGIVLEATAPTVRGWGRSRVPLPLLPFVRLNVEPQLAGLDVVAALDHFDGRLLLLASSADELAPVDLSSDMLRRLRRAKRDVRLVQFPRRHHGQIMRSADFPFVMQRFLQELENRK